MTRGALQRALKDTSKPDREEARGHENKESQAVVAGPRRIGPTRPDAAVCPAGDGTSPTRTCRRTDPRRDPDPGAKSNADSDTNPYPDSDTYANPNAGANGHANPDADPFTDAIRVRDAVRDPDYADDDMDHYVVHVVQLLPLAER
jgi:hypothetical protein